jgi:hypothetical protein
VFRRYLLAPSLSLVYYEAMHSLDAETNVSSKHFWHAVVQLVEALCYKPEGRGFDSYEGIGVFN